MSEESSHNWRETVVKDRFPLVCSRCLMRSDNPNADLPCDAAAEVVRNRAAPRNAGRRAYPRNK